MNWEKKVKIYTLVLFMLMPAVFASAQTDPGGSVPVETPIAEPATATTSQIQQPQARTSTGTTAPAAVPTQTTSTPAVSPAGSASPAGTSPTPAPVNTTTTEPTPTEAVQTPLPSQPLADPNQPQPLGKLSPLGAVVAGIVVLAAGLAIFGILKAKNKGQKGSGRCDKIRVVLEQKRQARSVISSNLSLQEQLIAAARRKIEEKIEETKNALKERIAEAAKDAVLKTMNSKTMDEAVRVAEQAKETYDDLIAKSEQAKKLIETLKTQKDALTKEITVLETTYNVCMQGSSGTQAAKDTGAELELPDARDTAKRVLVIGASLSGKTSLIGYLRSNSNLPLSEMDEELTELNGGEYPTDVQLKQTVLAPQIIKKILGAEEVVFFTNTDYFSANDIQQARRKGFRVIQLSLPIEKLKERNRFRVEHEGYEDMERYLDGMVKYQNNIKEKGLVDALVNADQPTEDVAKELFEVL